MSWLDEEVRRAQLLTNAYCRKLGIKPKRKPAGDPFVQELAALAVESLGAESTPADLESAVELAAELVVAGWTDHSALHERIAEVLRRSRGEGSSGGA